MPPVRAGRRTSTGTGALASRHRNHPQDSPLSPRQPPGPPQLSASPALRTTSRPPNHRPARTTIHCLLTTRIEIPILPRSGGQAERGLGDHGGMLNGGDDLIARYASGTTATWKILSVPSMNVQELQLRGARRIDDSRFYSGASREALEMRRVISSSAS
jgi:hypothetical protein